MFSSNINDANGAETQGFERVDSNINDSRADAGAGAIKAPFSAPPLPRKQAREWPLMPGHRTCSKNRNTIVSAAAAATDTRPSKGADCLCQDYVTRAATATIVQASERTAVNQGTVVCSAAAAVEEASKGMVVDAGAPYLALGDSTTSGEGVRIKEGNDSTASGSFITIS